MQVMIDYKFYQEQLLHFGLKMVENHLTAGSGGNLSMKVKGQEILAITPSGIRYEEITEEDIVFLDFQGNILKGERRPSSEWELHTATYMKNPEAEGVIHTHSSHVTALACMGLELPAVHYLVATAGGKKIPLAKYKLFGTHELAQTAVEAMYPYKAVILEHHGLLAWSNSLSKAFEIAEEVELCAKLYLEAMRLEKVRLIPDDEMDKVLLKFKSYGQRGD